ncbi:hypothetical protein BDV97DRAFT_18479 [Delphinella strobiligena]|nr:hypothetical protein BDV97DRAFT_18479 [Delphinella strobiligena]
MAKLFGSRYDEQWRGLPLELREQIYEHLLCPPGGISLVLFSRRELLHYQTEEHPTKDYVEEPRHSCQACKKHRHDEYDDWADYHYPYMYSSPYDYDGPYECSHPSLDQNGLSEYDNALVPYPDVKLAPKREQSLHLEILQTNRQTYQEALTCLYRHNVWNFDARCGRILHFLQSLAPKNRLMIKNIRISRQAILQHKANKRHPELSRFLTNDMELKSVTVAMPGYEKFRRMSQSSSLPNVIKAV